MSEKILYVAQKGQVVKWTIPKRDLEPNQVRVKVHSIGINPVDWKTIDNNLADGAGQGNDFAGVVVEVGSDVKTTKVGDTVAGGVGGGDVDKKENGSFTDLLTVDEYLLFKFPQKLEAAKGDTIPCGVPTTFEQASSLGIAADTNAIAYDGYTNPGPSDWALVYGVTSSLGFVAAQFALNLGYKVIGVSAPHNEIVGQLQGIHWLDRSDSEWVSKAREISGNQIVFGYDTIGMGDSANQVFNSLSTKVDSLACFSSPGLGPDQEHISANPKGQVKFPLYFLLMQEQKKFGPAALGDDYNVYKRSAELLERVNAQIAKGQIKALPIKVIHGLDKINEALDVNRKGVRGTKIVVNVD